MGKFIWFLALLVTGILLPATTMAESSAQPSGKPLRVAIVGLVHGHVSGFLGPALKRSDIQIVGIVEPDQELTHGPTSGGAACLCPTATSKPFLLLRKRPGRQTALARTMAALLQRAQIVPIITAVPTIKRLVTDAKMTAGMGHVGAGTIEIHPSQPNPPPGSTPFPSEPVVQNQAVSPCEFAL